MRSVSKFEVLDLLRLVGLSIGGKVAVVEAQEVSCALREETRDDSLFVEEQDNGFKKLVLVVQL